MFNAQKTVLAIAPALAQLLPRYEQSTAWLDEAVAQTNHFVVPVPLVGAFSSGKSSLLNAYLGTPYFATSLDPETAVPAEIEFAEQESIHGCLRNGRRIPLTHDALRDNAVQELTDGGWVHLRTPAPRLAAVPHLRLVDLPGWDSGLKEHEQAIDGYAARSLAYVVVVSADEGNLRSSIRNALLELKVHQRPVAVVISKSDKKAPEDVQAVADTVVREVTQAIGKAPVGVAIASARKREVEAFASVLATLEGNAEALYVESVGQPLATQLLGFHSYLQTRISAANWSGDDIAARLAQQARELEAFDRKFRQETDMFDRRAMAAADRIVQQVSAALAANADALAAQVCAGANVSGQLGSIIRLAVTQGYHELFLPELKRYCTDVEHALPEHIVAGMRMPDGPAGGLFDDLGSLATLAPVVLPLLTMIPVIGPIIAPAMKFILPLISVVTGGAMRNALEAQRREAVMLKLVNEVFRDAAARTREGIIPPLRKMVEEAKTAIEKTVAQQRDIQVKALEQARADQSRQQAEFEAVREQLRADATTTRAMLKDLGVNVD
ncbi:hypothetical protein LMG23992_02253 [Cupriavidus laharis]|uniref:Dynamin N-terminal domain-containing protein n=1 Tax=Cupriavidus laharis TaxID=151654 RepID=A0ABN7YGC4_9BURK|nr:dynamin family protein [Cupriavidus laharis]CAG9172504.1 hypothetical protein LMG23992_02253 [Cupriavidus laharis]